MRGAIGAVHGTPTLFINDERFPGPHDHDHDHLLGAIRRAAAAEARSGTLA